MQYLYMRPDQIRTAIDAGTPVVLPLGVVEYHAEHLPLGVDMFVAQEVIRRVEARHPELIVLPPFPYGAASLAVAKPERNGTIQVSADKLVPVAQDIFRGLLRVGFRNIHAFIAHQTEEFAQGMPTDLAFRFAARQVIFEWLEQHAGEGWWGTEKYSSYYSGTNNPFAWIAVHPVRTDEAVRALFPGDHAGKLETSEAMVICPDAVDPSRIDDSLWYARTAHEADAAYGEAALEAAARDVEKQLFGD
ncbi:MAG: creatininase family protein [Clostridiales bacterium]|jgi:creatinine amidohydrolase/Fe(II)-dependent formamide hydrolase-like protein|nr:creatininase family protein [Clostridiales bacterium]